MVFAIAVKMSRRELDGCIPGVEWKKLVTIFDI